MKKILTIITLIVVMITMTVPAQAEVRYLSGPFEFGSYAPVVRIRHKVYPSWALQQQKNGSVSWCGKAYDRDNQYFVILPTSDSGYYAFRSVSAPWKYLTYNKSNGKVTMASATEKPDYDGGSYQPGKTQRFRIQWKTSVKTAGGRTVKNCYRLICQDGNRVVCFGGWAPFDIEQINA